MPQFYIKNLLSILLAQSLKSRLVARLLPLERTTRFVEGHTGPVLARGNWGSN
jgi:hypothetical protein